MPRVQCSVLSVAERSELCLPLSFSAAETAGLCLMPLPKELAQDYEKAARENDFSQLLKDVSAKKKLCLCNHFREKIIVNCHAD